MQINQKYIAELLNVSRVTVTKALQDHEDIAPATRERIKKKAEELGYIPNGIGRSLSTKKTHTIGLVVPKIDHSFFSSLIENIYAAAIAKGYKILVMVSFENSEIELDSIKTLLSMNVDAIIIDVAVTTRDYKRYDIIRKNKKPLLFLDRKLADHTGGKGIFFSDMNLSYALTKAVIKKNKKSLMYLCGPDHISICQDRYQGFKDALLQYEIEEFHEVVYSKTLDSRGGYDAIKPFFLSTRKLPEVIMCTNDSLALGVYQLCEELKIDIPKEVGVAGFGNVLVSELVQPPLTTVNLDHKQACESCIEVLIDCIENKKDLPEIELFTGQILIRDSI
jgi:DNA-binding LacI/PurR family transcriptional regulator